MVTVRKTSTLSPRIGVGSQVSSSPSRLFLFFPTLSFSFCPRTLSTSFRTPLFSFGRTSTVLTPKILWKSSIPLPTTKVIFYVIYPRTATMSVSLPSSLFVRSTLLSTALVLIALVSVSFSLFGTTIVWRSISSIPRTWMIPIIPMTFVGRTKFPIRMSMLPVLLQFTFTFSGTETTPPIKTFLSISVQK